MRRPGCRKERGTQVGARRSRPPVRASSASTGDLVVVLKVLRERVFMLWAELNRYAVKRLHRLSGCVGSATVASLSGGGKLRTPFWISSGLVRIAQSAKW